MERIIADLAALQEEAAVRAGDLTPRTDSATLVTLTGELGAGKTAFTKALAKAFGVKEVVNSPTFVIERIYALPKESGRGFARLIHIDAYRLEGGSALAPLGFDEVMKDPGNLVIIEWPEQVAEALPRADYAFSLEALPDGSRLLRSS